MNEEIKKLTPEEVLRDFFNQHIIKLIGSWINIELYKNKKPDEIVLEKQTQPLGNNRLPATIQIRAKEALRMEEGKFKGQSDVLRAIEKKEKELKKLKDNIWQ